jgi:hypothetical protein
MRNDPRLEFWDSTDPKSFRRDLPSNARAVLFTRYISHELNTRLRKQAHKRGIFCQPGMHETGELRVELQRVVDHVPPKRVEPIEDAFERLMAQTEVMVNKVAEHAQEPILTTPAAPAVAEAAPRKRYRIASFIAEHGDLTVTKNRAAEATRVLALMEAHGLKSTMKSVLETMRVMQKKAGVVGLRRTPPRGNGAVTAAPAIAPPRKIVLPPPVAAARASAPPILLRESAPPPVPAIQEDALIQAIGEAEHYIDDMQAAAKLLAELMPRLKAEIAKFRDRQRRAREIFLD